MMKLRGQAPSPPNQSIRFPLNLLASLAIWCDPRNHNDEHEGGKPPSPPPLLKPWVKPDIISQICSLRSPEVAIFENIMMKVRGQAPSPCPIQSLALLSVPTESINTSAEASNNGVSLVSLRLSLFACHFFLLLSLLLAACFKYKYLITN